MMIYTVEITIKDNESTKGFEITNDQLKSALLDYHDLLHGDDVKVNVVGSDSY